MPELPAPREGNTNNTGLRFGGKFLKAADLPSILKGAERLYVEIEARATTRDNAAAEVLGPAPGRYGIDVPISIGKETFIATIPDWTPDYRELCAEFGRDSSEWVGQSLAIWTEEVSSPVRDFQSGEVRNEVKTYLRFGSTESVMKALPKIGRLDREPVPDYAAMRNTKPGKKPGARDSKK